MIPAAVCLAAAGVLTVLLAGAVRCAHRFQFDVAGEED